MVLPAVVAAVPAVIMATVPAVVVAEDPAVVVAAAGVVVVATGLAVVVGTVPAVVVAPDLTAVMVAAEAAVVAADCVAVVGTTPMMVADYDTDGRALDVPGQRRGSRSSASGAEYGSACDRQGGDGDTHALREVTHGFLLRLRTVRPSNGRPAH
ncbi:hypothetical protein AB0L50_17085 [Streptomyces flaveolus]|uniref:hypothetical protein n=1 Tax=Streptomyces flaveolus TaxID=67297 RepID=UPI00342D9E05